ncbi:hypothetical protein DFH28DRAFT_937993 [Melampsora americana]|nr:hypothetical protein DFH28DRAFT_937993 [Melampsora americana]
MSTGPPSTTKPKARTLHVSGPMDVFEVVNGVNLTTGREANKALSPMVKSEETVHTPGGRARGKFADLLSSNANPGTVGEDEAPQRPTPRVDMATNRVPKLAESTLLVTEKIASRGGRLALASQVAALDPLAAYYVMI